MQRVKKYINRILLKYMYLLIKFYNCYDVNIYRTFYIFVYPKSHDIGNYNILCKQN